MELVKVSISVRAAIARIKTYNSIPVGVLFEKLLVTQFPSFHATRKSVTVLERTRHKTLPETSDEPILHMLVTR
jgi:hypothetical protein